MYSWTRSAEMRCCCIETRDVVILQKIVMYCLRIAENLDRFHHDFSAFENDHLFQDACCMCVVQIGELVALLSDAVKQQNTAVPWRVIKDTRNFYVVLLTCVLCRIRWSRIFPL